MGAAPLAKSALSLPMSPDLNLDAQLKIVSGVVDGV
jgi:hypothetical protein